MTGGEEGFRWEAHVTEYLVIIQPQRETETFCAVAENDSTWSSSTQIKAERQSGRWRKAMLHYGLASGGKRKSGKRQKLARNIKAAGTATGE